MIEWLGRLAWVLAMALSCGCGGMLLHADFNGPPFGPVAGGSELPTTARPIDDRIETSGPDGVLSIIEERERLDGSYALSVFHAASDRSETMIVCTPEGSPLRSGTYVVSFVLYVPVHAGRPYLFVDAKDGNGRSLTTLSFIDGRISGPSGGPLGHPLFQPIYGAYGDPVSTTSEQTAAAVVFLTLDLDRFLGSLTVFTDRKRPEVREDFPLNRDAGPELARVTFVSPNDPRPSSEALDRTAILDEVIISKK